MKRVHGSSIFITQNQACIFENRYGHCSDLSSFCTESQHLKRFARTASSGKVGGIGK